MQKWSLQRVLQRPFLCSERRVSNGTVVKHDIGYQFSDFSVLLFIAPRRSEARCDSCGTCFLKMKFISQICTKAVT